MTNYELDHLPEGIEVVMIIGNFDGVHLGHQKLFNTALIKGDELGVATMVWTFKDHPQSIMAPDTFRYISSKEDKFRYIEKMGISLYHEADFNEYRDMSPEQFVDEVIVKNFNSRHVVCGYDFSFGKGGIGTPKLMGELLAKHGVGLTVLRPVYCEYGRVSSTNIRRMIAEGKVKEASICLGGGYGFKLPVERGKGLARNLGYPTINQRFPKGMAVPSYGVYAVNCIIDGRMMAGIANIGVKPTVDGGVEEPICETHIFDYYGDLYSKEIRVLLREKIRDEKKFDSLKALKRQIDKDYEQVRKRFVMIFM